MNTISRNNTWCTGLIALLSCARNKPPILNCTWNVQKQKFFFCGDFHFLFKIQIVQKLFSVAHLFFLYKLNLYLILKIKFVFNRFFFRNSLSTLSPFLYHFIESPFTSTSLSTFKKKEILTVVYTCSKKPNFQSHHIKRNDWGKKKTTLKFFFFFFFFPFPSPYYHLPFKLYTSGDIISLLSRYLANQHIYLCVIPDSCRQPKKKER